MPSDLKFRHQKWRTIIAVSFGNALEWFDFVIFGYFAVAISKQFFPVGDPASALMLSLATFGVAFIVRPLGAVIIGHYADRHGRKPALALTISLMTIGTALIAFAPTYRSVGLLAPLIMVVARIIQGLSAGGEFGSATTLLAEQDPRSRGFIASWQFASQALTLVLATSVSAILSAVLDAEQINTWGWRIPFIFGILIGPIAIYIRNRLPESSEFNLIRISSSPAYEIVSNFKSKLLIASGLVTIATAAVYTLVFMPTFCVEYLGYPMVDGFLTSLFTGVLQVVLIPIAGALSDKCGRLMLACGASLVILITAIPMLARVTSAPTFGNLLLFQLWIGANVAIYVGTLPAMMAELFPTEVRSIGLSVSYSIAVTIFGGFAPFINGLLIKLSGSNLAPGYYLSAAALISLMALAAARKAGLK